MNRLCLPVLALAAIMTSPNAEAGGAVSIEVGQRYSGPKRLSVSGTDVSFAIPRGVHATATHDGIVFGHARHPGRALGLSMPGTPKAELRTKMASTLPLGGVVLEPDGPIKKRGKKLVQRYRYEGGRGVAVGRVGPNNNAVTIIAVSTTAIGKWKKIAGSIVDSLKFTAPRPSGGRKGYWARTLSGVQASSLSSSGGSGSSFTSSTQYNFCPDGTYHSSSSSSGFSNTTDGYGTALSGVSHAGTSRAAGHWRVRGTQAKGILQLRAEGESSWTSVTVSRGAKGEFLVDGDRWLLGRRASGCN